MFWDRFFHLCELHNKKPTPLGRELGISSGIITTWKKEGHCPSGEMLIKIANYFDCSIDYLVGRSDCMEIQKTELTHLELQFLEKLRTLPEDSQDEILYMLNYKYDKYKNREKEISSLSNTSEKKNLLA